MNTQILKNICEMKRRLLPNDRLILFGSQVRGDARPDSDWDLLLLLNKSRKEQSDEDKSFEFVLMGWEYGTYLSIKIFTKQEWERGKTFPFYKNVEKEGMEIN
ncbi:MAG: nucleotidyltransferase domain-containing protein [Prevotellaceae bacterium]|jgi:predicted nucleotidyltransferase|nr:nucleotidyltransferase domain-containing protein [Prevotellaceae bacterium]